MKTLFIFLSLLTLASSAFAGDYNFDWKSKNDMQGAWLMCSTTGFSQGDCPKVLRKCWQPPLIKCRRGKCKTLCTGMPSFSTSQADVTDALHTVAPDRIHSLPNNEITNNAFKGQSVTGNSFQPVAPVCDTMTGKCEYPSH